MKKEYPKRKRCPHCIKRHPQSQGSGGRDYSPAMSSMYIRVGDGNRGTCWIAVGWFCRNCGKMMRLRKMDCKNNEG